jgi:hypothetical protein
MWTKIAAQSDKKGWPARDSSPGGAQPAPHRTSSRRTPYGSSVGDSGYAVTLRVAGIRLGDFRRPGLMQGVVLLGGVLVMAVEIGGCAGGTEAC